jgi:hypothetical protein
MIGAVPLVQPQAGVAKKMNTRLQEQANPIPFFN